MVHFSKLKLYGFKSFVDKTELEIGPGLNGIVGPNGCGKSNLVEALRWVMGEKSAKNMRGGGMEDVIFAGTSKRPARNMAEVTVVMNNEDATAPAPFTNSSEIEINRRIEKDKGSQYRVNGKAVRARDVNLLFADTMTGANSPALVSQGRITEIITAKPSDRRRILEESAGISGLHTRRHEAELRLRAAEQNLTRLNDSLNDMRNRLTGLKRQARQAERYKELSDSIRRLELALSWGEWSKIHQKIKSDRQLFSQHNEAVQIALQETKTLTTQVEELEQSLPQGRKQAMEAQAVLQNFRVSLDRLEQDIQTKAKGLQDALDAKAQLEQDNQFTQNQYTQVISNLEKAQSDLSEAMESGDALPAQIAEAETKLSDLQIRYDAIVSEKQSHETAIAVAKETRANLQKQSDSVNETLSKLSRNIDILSETILDTETRITDLKKSPELGIDLKVIETNIQDLAAKIENDQANYITLEKKHVDAKNRKNDLTSSLTALQGEYKGLEALLFRVSNQGSMPQGDNALFNKLSVKSGYEKAVSSALGQWIMMAGLDDTSSVYWSSATAAVKAPEGTMPLIDVAEAPATLHPFLQSVGYIEQLPSANQLSAGQMIVAKDGSFMRWDGLIVKAEALENLDQAGLILEQKNRISQLQKDIDAKQAELETANQSLETIVEELDKSSLVLKEYREQKVLAENNLRDTRYQQERINDQIISLDEKLTEQQTRLAQNKQEQQQTELKITEFEAQLSAADDKSLASKESEIHTLNHQINIFASEIEDSRQILAVLRQSLATTTQTKQNLTLQIERLNTENQNLSERLTDFGLRQKTVEDKINSYKTTDDDNSETIREDLLSKITKQEESVRELQIKLETQESAYRNVQTKLREAEASAALAREHRATAQANVANSENDLKRLTDDIQDNFELSPQALEERVFSLFNEQIPDLTDLQNEKDIITRQRDNIGPVNLRAAIECQETETELATLENEYDDLTKAIEQLRGGIARLNREAKERLAIAFQRVDLHFQRLFTKLFEGGKAYLEMIQNDDPLESGLEIYAQPPGKALQKLSLLSGGEQTLTATALIFAMFLTNPSPICVLDEIDAPLDDANVDRICSLMENIVEETSTRFIVITHHRMTMARMNRLYGVTMSERGVSQLVSVDLALQEELELAETA